MDNSEKLSTHFILGEFIISQTAERLGIDNIPTEQIIKNLKRLCDVILEPARISLGPLKISSGYRCPLLNSSISGSSITSAHVLGFAADVIPLSVSMMDFAKWIYKNVPFDQIILEFGKPYSPAWIHVSCDPKERRQVLRILRGTGYEQYNLS